MDLGLYQREVADILGVHKVVVENWERENASPIVQTWPKVIEFLGYDPTPAGHTIGEKLRRHRRAAGLSTAELARLWSMDPATVSTYESKDDRLHNHLSIPHIARFIGYNPLPPPKTPGQYTRQVRYLAGFKQTAFATQVQVTNNTVSEWELEQRIPTLKQFELVEAIAGTLPKPLRFPSPDSVKTQCKMIVKPNRRTEPRSVYPVELKTLGDHIRSRRLDLGLSQATLARQFSVNRNTVTGWETGDIEPHLTQMSLVMEFLGYEPSFGIKALADEIRNKRRSLGLTQVEFGELIGVCRETVILWEKGKRKPTGSALKNLKLIFENDGNKYQ